MILIMSRVARCWKVLSVLPTKISNKQVQRTAVLVVSVLLTWTFIMCQWPAKKLTREERYRKMVESIRSVTKRYDLWNGHQACKRPEMEAFSQEIMKYVKEVTPIVCAGEKDWVEVDGATAYVTAEARSKHGNIDCQFTNLKRISDFSVWPGLSTRSSDRYLFTTSDFARVTCVGKSGQTWSNILAGARHNDDIVDRTGWDKVPQRAMKLNVLMFGFDSVSRLNFIRKLPKSFDYITRELAAVVLEGYNIVGDGTPQAIIPILTGKSELELPDTRRRKRQATYVNAYPFIWNDFQDAGYVTGYMEDTPSAGIFTYRLKGFKNVPTDHYMRTYFLDAELNFYDQFSDRCLGSRPRHKVMMDYIKSVFKTYKERPKFVFGFHGEISHNDMNMVGAADLDLLEWLQWYKKEHWDDTILILMSDHGNRYGPSRSTQQGKLEERLPFFSFIFPPWFGTKHPEAFKNFKANSRRLTTPFDIHATLSGILNQPSFGMGNLSNRGISLFQEIPPSRTCSDAFIEPHWCACMEWEACDKNDPLLHAAGESLVTHINDYNAKYTDKCELMGLRHVSWAAKLVPSQTFRKFRKTKDTDGMVPDMTGDMDVTAVVFQLQIVTDPGQATFEAAVTHNPTSGMFTFRMEEISRINEYGAQARCIHDTLEHLRKFCYCKN